MQLTINSTMAFSDLLRLLVTVLCPVMSGAFFPLHSAVASRIPSKVALSGVVTGPKGKPASSFEDDLFLTLKVIMDHDARSTTVSKEQFLMQMQETKKLPKSLPPADVSVPYNAPAQLAYEATDMSVPFEEFEAKYQEDVIQQVKAKTIVGKSKSNLLLSLCQGIWSRASRFAGWLSPRGSALFRRLCGATQKIVWKIKLRGG
jgi:hypothetical protein